VPVLFSPAYRLVPLTYRCRLGGHRALPWKNVDASFTVFLYGMDPLFSIIVPVFLSRVFVCCSSSRSSCDFRKNEHVLRCCSNPFILPGAGPPQLGLLSSLVPFFPSFLPQVPPSHPPPNQFPPPALGFFFFEVHHLPSSCTPFLPRWLLNIYPKYHLVFFFVSFIPPPISCIGILDSPPWMSFLRCHYWHMIEASLCSV